MPKNEPLDDTDEEDFSEVERERTRELRSNYVKSGIVMNRKHKKWLQGRRAAEEAGASQRAAMNGEQWPPNPDIAPEVETFSQQVCNPSFLVDMEAHQTPRPRQVRVRMRKRQPRERFKCTASSAGNGTGLKQPLILEHQRIGSQWIQWPD
jgi:hypothetical protein